MSESEMLSVTALAAFVQCSVAKEFDQLKFASIRRSCKLWLMAVGATTGPGCNIRAPGARDCRAAVVST